MTLQQKLHETLAAMMQLIEAGSPADNRGQGLVDHLQRLDHLKEELGGQAPPMLLHYLEKRSYAKALDFLEGNDGTLGPNC
jgi:hypothetical protein